MARATNEELAVVVLAGGRRGRTIPSRARAVFGVHAVAVFVERPADTARRAGGVTRFAEVPKCRRNVPDFGEIGETTPRAAPFRHELSEMREPAAESMRFATILQPEPPA